MQVLFDLRPPHMVALQSQTVDSSRVISLLLFVIFILASLGNIGFTTLQYFQVSQQLASSRGEQANVQSSTAQLEAKIAEVRKLRDQIRSYLEFTREEVPAVEFMKALEEAIPDGLKIATLEIRQGNVMMVGSALTVDQITEFTANLAKMNYIVTSVGSPVNTQSVLGTRQIADFRLTCDVRKIVDIAANDPSQQGEGGGQ